jgi:hypothetical protein
MSEFGNLAIGSIFVIPLVMGITQFAKKFGADGNVNLIITFLTAIVFGGIAYGIDQALLPADVVPYVKWGVFALAVGLGASGLYDVGKTRFGTNQ